MELTTQAALLSLRFSLKLSTMVLLFQYWLHIIDSIIIIHKPLNESQQAQNPESESTWYLGAPDSISSYCLLFLAKNK